MRVALPVALVLCLVAGTARHSHALGNFVEFETGQTRPLALSPNGTKLFAVNTPDNRLEIFDVDANGALTAAGSVPVGMEPVAVAARTDTEVWVVNHLSDSVSIVDLSGSVPRVVNTLLVGDEPRDIVFAGSDGAGNLVGNRAFITTAHRGQNSGVPQGDFITEGLERADVWVFNALNLGTALGGTPVTVVELFGDTPRALARNADGSRVYAAVFQSGNRTTTVNEASVCNGGAGAGPCTVSGNTAPGGLPAPSPLNCAGAVQPETGLIVKFNGSQWVDELGRNWSNMVKLELPDQDVFAINADAGTPALTGTPWAGVGTILFNMAVNPVSGRIYVSNTEAKNERRFEGPGTCSTTVQGRLAQARITVLDGASVNPRHLNKHIDYNVKPAPATVKAKSLATPLDMVVTPDGSTLYVAAFGSSAIGKFNTAQLEADTFAPDASTHIAVTGGGPSGLVLRGNRIYVFTRFDNGISTIDTTAQSQIAHLTLFNPEPARDVIGRPFLYDAVNTSSNGEASCSSCHIFGDFDSLAWDLGNPADNEVTSPLTQKIPPSVTGSDPDFFPMKGPMTTQSLRGLANAGAMHWRGDRSVGEFGTAALDEQLSFNNFIVAFPGLLGRASEISHADMQKFTDFMLDVTYPPNPIRPLNNTLPGGSQAAQGEALFNGAVTDTLFNCNGCHTLNPSAGFFGTDGSATFEGETQHFKVPHLRNMYQKIGMFGMPTVPGITTSEPGTPQGPQVRGFGFLHDGSIPTIHRFHGGNVFTTSDAQERNLEQFMLVFPSTLAPIVGQQITLTSANGATVGPRISLLIQRAQTTFALVNHPGARECDLIVKGTVGGEQRGWRMNSVSGAFLPDKTGDPQLNDTQLRALAGTPGQELTYTCAPPGSGQRMGIDRNANGILDRDEGSTPAGGCASAPRSGCAVPGKSLFVVRANTIPSKEKMTWKWLNGTAALADFGGPDVSDGYSLCVYQGGVLLMHGDAPAAGTCGTKPCWRNNGPSGFKFSNSSTTSTGMLKVVLKPGTGTGKIVAKGRGANLTLPGLPFTTPFTVQMQGSHGVCWEHVYNSAGVVRSDDTQFKGNGG